jgi:drug/metabolite transporter (DMT)-like permease
MGIGTIIAIHWVAFYGSIKYANASIALTCLATAGIFTAILEPIVLKVKFNVKELIIGFIALIGMYSIYHFEVQYAFGIMLGIFASILSAVFTILNKKIIHKYPSRLVAFYEIGSGFLFLTLLLPVYLYLQPNVSFVPIHYDWIWLLILSLCCTVWGQSLALSALKKLSSFTTVLMVNLEPVYGILLAMLIYHENKDLGIGFYLGILLIAFSVALHTLMMYIEKKRERKMIA